MWNKNECEVPRSEFEARIKKVAGFAAERDLGAVVVHSAPRIHQWSQTGHVGYLTNWSNLDRITDAMVVVTREAEAILLVPGVEYMLEQIQEVSWITDVRLVSSPDPRAIAGAFDPGVGGEEASQGARTFGGEVNQILREGGRAEKPIGISGVEAMPATIYHDLETSLEGRLAEAPDIVARLRSIKSPQEVEILKQVAALSDRCYERMMEVLREGMWGYELSAEMDFAARRQGADLVYNCIHSAPGGDLEKGKLSIKSHDWKLHRGDYINLNAYVVYKGYWIQSDRAGTLGPELGSSGGRLLEANLRIQDQVLAAIEPGLAIGEMVSIADEAAARQGYRIQGGRIGHGQGLDYSEMPFLITGSEEKLQPGNVFVLHVCLELPGTNVLINPIADLCHVQADGVEVLNHFPRGVFHAQETT